MSELIRREDAIKATWQEPSYTDPYNVLTEVRDRINALPTIDAVPVVRCGECKWWNKQKDSCQGHCELFGNYPMYPTGAWYCANGERRKTE